LRAGHDAEPDRRAAHRRLPGVERGHRPDRQARPAGPGDRRRPRGGRQPDRRRLVRPERRPRGAGRGARAGGRRGARQGGGDREGAGRPSRRPARGHRGGGVDRAAPVRGVHARDGDGRFGADPGRRRPGLGRRERHDPLPHRPVAFGMQSSEGFVFVRPGLNLYFRTVGEGPEILLVPNANWLGEMLHPLASGRTLLFFDPRSRGRSSAVTDPKQLSLDADVEDLETVRRFFGAERVSLLGTSYHAAIAATYALENPERVDRLILSCPITPRIPGEWAQELPPSEVLVYPPGVPRLEELRKAGVD